MVVRPCSGLGGRQTEPLPYDPLSIIFLIDNHGSASSWPNLPRPSRDGCSSYCFSQRTLLRRAPPIGTALGVRRKKAARLAPFFPRDHWRLWRHFCVRARGGRADSLRRRRPYDYFLFVGVPTQMPGFFGFLCLQREPDGQSLEVSQLIPATTAAEPVGNDETTKTVNAASRPLQPI
jgi:hypothetical protein